jgi:DNA-directed RNA polymerase specialized sigma24 family protein
MTFDTTSARPISDVRRLARYPNAIGPRLRLDWDRLRRRRDVLERAHGWRVVDVTFDDLQHLVALAGGPGAGTVHPDSDGHDGEVVLRRLVEVAVDDDLAARVVLQRILPGLLAVARRRQRRWGGSQDALEELVGAAWITIRTFDPRRRPASLAAALIAGADHRAFVKPLRRRAAAEHAVRPHDLVELPADPHATEPEAAVDPVQELAALLRAARRAGVAEDDVRFVRDLVRSGSTEELAEELGVSGRAVRYRRARVSERLRRVAVAA